MFRNPVLPGFYPDPSIVRVGKDFYLVTSTFGWFPGLPIFHSTDLVNWKLIGHAIDRPGMVDLGHSRLVADGLYAPAIDYRNGLFVIFNTCVRCGGNFFVTARDPAGPWSDPIWVDIGGIDPSLFVDEDGQAWVINNDAPPGDPLYEGHRAIWIQPIDLASGEVTGERTLLVNGGTDLSTQPVWAEGPHIYRMGGWYYLSVAEGGTMDQHSQTIYRSRSVTGPYEPGPVNPTLTQRDLPADRADRVEATGHADMVRLDDGSWWATFLAMRPFTGMSTLLGRESWLLPVEWTDGWPRVLAPGEPVPLISTRPDLPEGAGTDWSRITDDFSNGKLAQDWLEVRNPAPVQWYALDRSANALLLVPGADAASGPGKPHFLGRRMRHPAARWTTRLTFAPSGKGEGAGLLAMANEENFLLAGIEMLDGETQIVVRRHDLASDPEEGVLIASSPFAGGNTPVDLRLTIRDGVADIDWRVGEGGWRTLAHAINIEHMASAHSDLFAGVVAGPYGWGAAD
ncbi:glycoside hydrolase family 43 protein [Aurantiacibacter spongiae]|nr:glycoside hydrolase family 43 protein [Aurantiacibacter spongiae]